MGTKDKHIKTTSLTFSHHPIFKGPAKNNKSPVNSNTFRQTYNAHTDQKFHQKTSSDIKVRTTNHFKSSFQPNYVTTQKKPMRTTNQNKTTSKVFDTTPPQVSTRHQNTFTNQPLGDVSLSQFRDYEDYKAFVAIQNTRSQAPLNQSKSAKQINIYNTSKINEQYLQQKQHDKANQKTDQLASQQHSRRLIENYCTSTLHQDTPQEYQLNTKDRVSQKDPKVVNDLLSVDPANLRYCLNKKIEYCFESDQQPVHLQKQNMDLSIYKKDPSFWQDSTNHDRKRVDPQFSDILGHEKAGVARPKQRTHFDAVADNWLNVSSKVKVVNKENREHSFQKRLNFLQSSMDQHGFKQHSCKQIIHDYDHRTYSHLDRRNEMSHKKLGDQE